jgi:hypothetical protein
MWGFHRLLFYGFIGGYKLKTVPVQTVMETRLADGGSRIGSIDRPLEPMTLEWGFAYSRDRLRHLPLGENAAGNFCFDDLRQLISARPHARDRTPSSSRPTGRSLRLSVSPPTSIAATRADDPARRSTGTWTSRRTEFPLATCSALWSGTVIHAQGRES